MQLKINRRNFLTTTAAGISLSGWLGPLAAAAPEGHRPKSCILLWMAGGPSHIDTFDPKPEAPAEVRGEFRAIETSVPGIRISEHFPRVAKLMQHAAILRGMSTLESDHKLATYHLHTGYQNRAGAVAFPSLGAIVAKELGRRDVALPNFITIGRGSQEALTAGFLGPDQQQSTADQACILPDDPDQGTKIYLAGNITPLTPTGAEDQWRNVTYYERADGKWIRHRPAPEDFRAGTPLPVDPVVTQSAREAYELVLARAGTRVRDADDLRVIEEVKARIGRKGGDRQ